MFPDPKPPKLTKKQVEWGRLLGGIGHSLGVSGYDPNYDDPFQWNVEKQSYDVKPGMELLAKEYEFPLSQLPGVRPAVPLSYQVKEGDTFGAIAKKYGLKETELQGDNDMVVPPPKGSFITLPNPNPRVRQPNLGANSFQSGSTVNLGELADSIRTGIASGQAPASVPQPLLASLGATPQSMAGAGYVYNNTTQTWNLPGTSAPAAAPAQSPKNVYWSKAKGYITPEVAALKAKKRRQRQAAGRQAAAAVSEATNAGGAPVTNLDVRVGSG